MKKITNKDFFLSRVLTKTKKHLPMMMTSLVLGGAGPLRVQAWHYFYNF